MNFVVNEKCQTASGGSFIAKYRGRINVAPGHGVATITVVSTIPESPDRQLLQLTVESIRRGAESVLQPLSLDGAIDLDDLFT